MSRRQDVERLFASLEGVTLEEYVAASRDRDTSWRDIAQWLGVAHDITVDHTTLYRWYGPTVDGDDTGQDAA